MLTESRAEESIVYKTEPSIVAEACQATLTEIGKVNQVLRESGIITGKFRLSLWTNPIFINIRISRHPEGTELHVQTQRKEGSCTSGGAQNGLAKFLCELGSDKRLTQSSISGW